MNRQLRRPAPGFFLLAIDFSLGMHGVVQRDGDADDRPTEFLVPFRRKIGRHRQSDQTDDFFAHEQRRFDPLLIVFPEISPPVVGRADRRDPAPVVGVDLGTARQIRGVAKDSRTLVTIDQKPGLLSGFVAADPIFSGTELFATRGVGNSELLEAFQAAAGLLVRVEQVDAAPLQVFGLEVLEDFPRGPACRSNPAIAAMLHAVPRNQSGRAH